MKISRSIVVNSPSPFYFFRWNYEKTIQKTIFNLVSKKFVTFLQNKINTDLRRTPGSSLQSACLEK